jgi:ribonuclease G
VRTLPHLQGRGQVKTARSVCYDILREILREARQFAPKEFRIVAQRHGGEEMLLDEESTHLAGLSECVGSSSAVPISLSAPAEPGGMSPEQYDIVLM